MPGWLNILKTMNDVINMNGINTKTHNGADIIETSEDSFHEGAFYALQPVGTGHRSGSDALLIAASLPQDASGLVADLGSGSGVAGIAAVVSTPGLNAILVEKNPIMVDLARKTLRLRPNLRYAERLQVLEADVTLSGDRREEVGLTSSMVDYVIMNPPYNHEGQRISPDAMREEAHVMGLFGLDCWMRTAVSILKPAGKLVLIYRTEKLGEVIACSQGRFGGITVVPIHARADEAASRLIFTMTKGSKAPFSIMPGVVMHNDDNSITELGKKLLNGEERVDFG